ncbi:MAG: hypothetical protein ACSHWW_10435 [Nonlabens sp.]|uniref:hypothetical protein n=1 Tax=Nonlabens sp. TaxID=1888209 RepID=UPI003EF53C6B
MKKLLILGLLAATTLVSCDRDTELRVASTSASGISTLSFDSNIVNFPVEINSTNFSESVDVQVNVTNSSSSDRVFNVAVTADSTADPVNYMVPGTVTVPAGMFNGTLTLTGQDTNLTTVATDIVLELTTSDPNMTVAGTTTVRIFQSCPVDETLFVGTYQMSHLIFNGFGVPTFGFGKMVDVSNPANDLVREFSAPYAPDLGSFSTQTYEFSLACNQIVWGANQDTAVGCGGAAPNIELNTADAAFGNGTYNPTDDSSFTMNFVDDDLDDCGARTNVTIQMTKQ